MATAISQDRVPIIEFFKVTWMVTWRLTIPLYLMGVGYSHLWALIIGAWYARWLVFDRKLSFRMWPLVVLTRKAQDASRPPATIYLPGRQYVRFQKDVRAIAKGRFRKSWLYEQHNQPHFGVPRRPIVDEYNRSTVGEGVPTIFNPNILKKEGYLLENDYLNYHHAVGVNGYVFEGNPASNVSEAQRFSQDNLSAGVAGEMAFAAALLKAGVCDHGRVAFSAHLPDVDAAAQGVVAPSQRYPHNDVDCIIATQDYIFLVDVKNYMSGGNFYYTNEGQFITTPAMDGLSYFDTTMNMRQPSRNMEMAYDFYTQAFPNQTFVPIVVLMPTDNGEPRVADDMLFPGGIKVVGLSTFLNMVLSTKKYRSGAKTEKAWPGIQQLIHRTGF